MLHGKRIAVVVPAYNEEKHIQDCLHQIPPYIDQVVVVDDASQDRTSTLAASVADERLVLLRHESNRGVGAAIMTGYQFAHKAGLDIAVVMAGDGQMHADDLPSLLMPILRDEADYVKGNRLEWPGAWRVIPPSRLLGILALNWLTRLSTGIGDLCDCQCGFTALRLSILSSIRQEQVYPRYGFPNDFLNHLSLAGARVKQRVVRPVYGNQRSDLKIRRVVLPILALLARGTGRRVHRRVAESLSIDRSSSRAPGEKLVGKGTP